MSWAVDATSIRKQIAQFASVAIKPRIIRIATKSAAANGDNRSFRHSYSFCFAIRSAIDLANESPSLTKNAPLPR